MGMVIARATVKGEGSWARGLVRVAGVRVRVRVRVTAATADTAAVGRTRPQRKREEKKKGRKKGEKKEKKELQTYQWRYTLSEYGIFHAPQNGSHWYTVYYEKKKKGRGKYTVYSRLGVCRIRIFFGLRPA